MPTVYILDNPGNNTDFNRHVELNNEMVVNSPGDGLNVFVHQVSIESLKPFKLTVNSKRVSKINVFFLVDKTVLSKVSIDVEPDIQSVSIISAVIEEGVVTSLNVVDPNVEIAIPKTKKGK